METNKNLLIVIAFASLFLLGIVGFGANAVFAENQVKPGKFVIEPPTLINLGFEWYVEGDDNRNAAVEVWYRRVGDRDWKQGLPLFRLFYEQTIYNPFNYVAPNMFAGSIFDLEADTEYECAFIMSDPDEDGVVGDPVDWHLQYGPNYQRKALKLVTVRTRAEPKPFVGGKTYHVYPRGYTGPKEQPAFTGLLSAYYTGMSNTDHYNVYPPRVEPGDTILVHAGVYIDTARYVYGGSGLGTIFDGTYRLTKSGTADKPIVIKAAGDGDVIFDGGGNYNLFNVMATNYTYFEGITFRGTDVAIEAGQKEITGSVGLTVKKCRFEDIGIGVHTDWSGSKNFYVADNVFIGRDDPTKLLGWRGATWEKFPGYPRPVKSLYAVKVYGSGNVVAYNYVANFHDGIDNATYGNPDGNPNVIMDRRSVAIDFYNNDISNIADNCIESDGTMHNTRMLRNRCFNVAHRALSVQPGLGGPAYWIRNIVYHDPEGGSTKWFDNAAGVVILHNTLIGQSAQHGTGYTDYTTSNVHFRNNLILEQGAFAGAFPEIFYMDTFTNYTSSDYNGYMPYPGAVYSYVWKSPPFNLLADYVGPREYRAYKTLAEYSAGTGQEKHSILVNYGIFNKVSEPNPADPQHLYNPADFDFGLRPTAVAIDAGCILPNVNDGFTGRAPDLGALEFGQPVPHYGPRP
jgi:hypothetical protein